MKLFKGPNVRMLVVWRWVSVLFALVVFAGFIVGVGQSISTGHWGMAIAFGLSAVIFGLNGSSVWSVSGTLMRWNKRGASRGGSQ